MSPIDYYSVTEKIAKLTQAIRNLKVLGKNTKVLKDDEILQGAVLHYLFLGIEAILDIGSHILVEEFDTSPTDYEQIITLLGTKKVISGELAKRSKGMGKFRNKMIHEYADINLELVISYLLKAPLEFETFVKAFKKYVTKK